jgi:hypothetical protein
MSLSSADVFVVDFAGRSREYGGAGAPQAQGGEVAEGGEGARAQDFV